MNFPIQGAGATVWVTLGGTCTDPVGIVTMDGEGKPAPGPVDIIVTQKTTSTLPTATQSPVTSQAPATSEIPTTTEARTTTETLTFATTTSAVPTTTIFGCPWISSNNHTRCGNYLPCVTCGGGPALMNDTIVATMSDCICSCCGTPTCAAHAYNEVTGECRLYADTEWSAVAGLDGTPVNVTQWTLGVVNAVCPPIGCGSSRKRGC